MLTEKTDYEKKLKNLLDVCSKKLCELYINQGSGKWKAAAADGIRLIFPHNRVQNDEEKSTRVSEQEARFCLAALLESERYPFYYSVETPTEEKYSFSGSTELAAQTDLTLYDEKLNKLFNVELKCNNVECDNDFEKLCREKPDGVWFHILENTDSGTLPSVLKKVTEALEKALPYSQYSEKKIVFAFCILKKQECHIFSVEFKKSEDVGITLYNSKEWVALSGLGENGH